MEKAGERAFLERFQLSPPEGFEQVSNDSAAPERGSREDVLAAVRKDGWALQRAPAHLQADREVVLAAVEQDGWALQFAARELHGDRDLVLRAVRKDGWVLSLASTPLRADKEVVLAAVGQDWRVLRIVPADLRADRDVVLKAVLQEGWALEFASAELQADRDVVLAAVNKTGEALRYARRFCGDYEVALAAAQNCGLVLALLEPDVQDLPLVLAAIRQDARAMDFVELRLRRAVQEALGLPYCPWVSAGQGQESTPSTARLADPALKRHLEQLGLPETASAEEIRQGFRRLALRYHPDKNSEKDVGKATEAFQRISGAYAALKEALGE
ncbi:dnaJ [Symbiodinium natans]|uniref:DnaJ protein n=1 Tax=Symbiodinium natans TaxID=878477 RepID=A0A812NT66_9DINO|nr:dnaJ [Symbiodinium natans]